MRKMLAMNGAYSNGHSSNGIEPQWDGPIPTTLDQIPDSVFNRILAVVHAVASVTLDCSGEDVAEKELSQDLWNQVESLALELEHAKPLKAAGRRASMGWDDAVDKGHQLGRIHQNTVGNRETVIFEALRPFVDVASLLRNGSKVSLKSFSVLISTISLLKLETPGGKIIGDAAQRIRTLVFWQILYHLHQANLATDLLPETWLNFVRSWPVSSESRFQVLAMSMCFFSRTGEASDVKFESDSLPVSWAKEWPECLASFDHFLTDSLSFYDTLMSQQDEFLAVPAIREFLLMSASMPLPHLKCYVGSKLAQLLGNLEVGKTSAEISALKGTLVDQLTQCLAQPETLASADPRPIRTHSTSLAKRLSTSLLDSLNREGVLSTDGALNPNVHRLVQSLERRGVRSSAEFSDEWTSDGTMSPGTPDGIFRRNFLDTALISFILQTVENWTIEPVAV